MDSSLRNADSLCVSFVRLCHTLCFLSCTRALRLREPIEAWFRSQKGKYENPIEMNHWEYMEVMLPVLNYIKVTSKYLEGQKYPTGSKALKKLWKMTVALQQVHANEPAAYTGLAMKPFCRDLLWKLEQVMNDPTLVWQWAFLALMDPSGGVFFVSNRRSCL